MKTFEPSIFCARFFCGYILLLGERPNCLHSGDSEFNSLLLICIDTFEGNHDDHLPEVYTYPKTHDMYAEFVKNTAPFDNIEVLRMRSDDAYEQIEDNSLDLLFIDGDHSYECIKSDLLLYKNKVKRRGILLLHDFPTTSKFLSSAPP